MMGKINNTIKYGNDPHKWRNVTENSGDGSRRYLKYHVINLSQFRISVKNN